jgi:hypothetical protein
LKFREIITNDIKNNIIFLRSLKNNFHFSGLLEKKGMLNGFIMMMELQIISRDDIFSVIINLSGERIWFIDESIARVIFTLFDGVVMENVNSN